LPDEDFTSGTAHCLFKNNWYLLRKNSIGTFLRPDRKEQHTYGLPVGPPPSFSFGLPKVPANILKWQISFYRKIMATMNDAEAYCSIMFDPQEQEYFIFVPHQKVSKASVNWRPAERDEQHPTCIPVLCCHSHNSMSAYFSSTDDADEKSDMLYMVMGTLNKSPTYSLRASAGGKECLKLNVSEIFEFSEEFPTWESLFATSDYEVPQMWLDRVGPYVWESKHSGPRSSSAVNPAFNTWSNGRRVGEPAQSSFSFSGFDRSGQSYFYGWDQDEDDKVEEGFGDFAEAVSDLARAIRKTPTLVTWESAIHNLVFELLDDNATRPLFFNALAELLLSKNASFGEFAVDLDAMAQETDIFSEEIADFFNEARADRIAELNKETELERFQW
jgi:hypothetical protein